MSSARPPEFFFDRSLGKGAARELRQAGWTVHLIADHYPTDAAHVPDPTWIREGCDRGWGLLTKDQRIRYRSDEVAALSGQMFCLAAGNLSTSGMAQRFLAAEPAILRAIGTSQVSFWLVYDEGRIERKWP